MVSSYAMSPLNYRSATLLLYSNFSIISNILDSLNCFSISNLFENIFFIFELLSSINAGPKCGNSFDATIILVELLFSEFKNIASSEIFEINLNKLESLVIKVEYIFSPKY